VTREREREREIETAVGLGASELKSFPYRGALGCEHGASWPDTEHIVG
jgi:hypothetical protein